MSEHIDKDTLQIDCIYGVIGVPRRLYDLLEEAERLPDVQPEPEKPDYDKTDDTKDTSYQRGDPEGDTATLEEEQIDGEEEDAAPDEAEDDSQTAPRTVQRKQPAPRKRR